MFFASDNWAGAHPRIAACLSAHAAGYRAGLWQRRTRQSSLRNASRNLRTRGRGILRRDRHGSQCAILVSVCNRVGGVVLLPCRSAYDRRRVRRAGLFHGRCADSAGSRRVGPHRPASARSRHHALRSRPRACRPADGGDDHPGDRDRHSLRLDDIDAISAVAKKHDLPLHMDGARFANALVALDVTPAEMTWKSGVDIVSFGGTKNGCWMRRGGRRVSTRTSAATCRLLRQRAGQLFSKSRFMAAQFEAYLADDLWLKTARHANAMAARLADVLRASNRVRLAWEPQANEVFAIMWTRESRADARGGSQVSRMGPAAELRWRCPGRRGDLPLRDELRHHAEKTWTASAS